MKIIRTDTFDKWLLKLRDKRALLLISKRVRRIENEDFGDCHTVGGYVSEIRIDYGAGYRVYFTKKGDEVVILLVGGTKHRQNEDIEKAKEMAKEWRKK